MPKSGYNTVKWLFGKEIELPEEWAVNEIQEIVKSIRSGVSRLLSPEDIGYLVLTSGNIQNDVFDPSDRKFWYKASVN